MEIGNYQRTQNRPSSLTQEVIQAKAQENNRAQNMSMDSLEAPKAGALKAERNPQTTQSRIQANLPLAVGPRMYMAAESDDTSEVLAMLRNGVSPNEKSYVCTPLCAAAGRDANNTMKLLLEWNAYAEDRGPPPFCHTPLHEAVSNCNIAATKILLNHGANVWAHVEPFDSTLIEMGTCDALIYAEGVAAWYPEGEELCRLVREAMAKQPRPKARVHSPPSSPSASKKPKTMSC